MTRRDQLFKWAVYALGLLPVWVLDAFVLSRYPLFGVTPILLPVAAAAVAVLEGAVGGAGFGLWIGLIWALSYPGVPAAMIFLLTLAGFFTGTLSQYALRSSFVGCIVCAAACLALLELFQVISGVIIQLGPLPALLSIALREWLLSLCWTPLIYLIFYRIYRRVGGQKLA